MSTSAKLPAPGAVTEMACWPPARTLRTSDGWRVGLSAGVTRRANSAVPLHVPVDVASAVEEVEALYGEHGQRPVIRVGGTVADAVVDHELDRRGWATLSQTDVLARELGDETAMGALPVSLEVTSAREPDGEWLDTYLAAKTAGRHQQVLTGILASGDAWHLTARDAAGPRRRVVGVIRVAQADGWSALSCLTVAPDARRRGIGRALTCAALRLAQEQGSTRVFLQVERSNAIARALYDDLGFVVVDSYAYREPADPGR